MVSEWYLTECYSEWFNGILNGTYKKFFSFFVNDILNGIPLMPDFIIEWSNGNECILHTSRIRKRWHKDPSCVRAPSVELGFVVPHRPCMTCYFCGSYNSQCCMLSPLICSHSL